tara:strand:+ start:1194 stop:1499 length:306 start_codon:yes stop_codon:yes gene_type:complete
MSILRATAKSFIPGSLEHIIKKVSWYSLGISNVKYFGIEEESTPAFPKGRRLVGPPASPIKKALGKEAVPFQVPPTPWIVDEPQVNTLVRQGPRRFNYCDN